MRACETELACNPSESDKPVLNSKTRKPGTEKAVSTDYADSAD